MAFAITSLTMTQIITMDRYILNIVFLLFTTLILIFYFKKEIIDVAKNTNRYEFIFLITISIMIHFVSSYYILNFLDQPIWPFDSKGTSFLLMNNFYLWVKPFDVLVQQILILIIVKKLYLYNLSLKNITVIFILGFGLIHIFQIFKTDVIIGLAFTIGAILSSFIYPYMILKVRNGYIYNYMIHMGIYNVAAILAWTLY